MSKSYLGVIPVVFLITTITAIVFGLIEAPARLPVMASKLFPTNPSEVMVFRKVTDSILTMSLPFARFGRAKIGGRGTVVKLPSGALAVFSPVSLTDDVKEHLNSLGNDVKYIAALDLEHHIFLGAWHQAYPDAKVLAPEGLPEKRKKQGNEQVRFDVLFSAKNFLPADPKGQSVDEEFDQEFDREFVYAHGNKEVVFNFRRERTLIQADLVFNLPAMEQYSKSLENPHTGLLTKMFNNINTQGAATWQKRFLWYFASSGDRDAFNASVARIAKWDFDRMIPCHGDVIETGAKALFNKVMAWHLPKEEST